MSDVDTVITIVEEPVVIEIEEAGTIVVQVQVAGPQGPRGPAGADGATGPAGPAGGDTTVTRRAASYTEVATNGTNVSLCDATDGDITANLPAAAANTGLFYVKKTDGSANQVIVNPAGAATIDGGATAVLANQNEAITLVSDGTNWSIL